MNSKKFGIERCGFAWIYLCFLWISVDLHGCMDFLNVVYGFLLICMDSFKSVVECCGFVWVSFGSLWISVDLHGCMDFLKVSYGFLCI